MADNPAKVLRQVCELCRVGQQNEARRLILQAAKISPEEQQQIPTGGMSRYILEKVNNENVRKMVQVENAYYHFGALYWRVCKAPKEIPTELEASDCINRFNNVMPLLSKLGQAQVKLWQDFCYDYVSGDYSEIRYKILNDVINFTPKTKPNADKTYLRCAQQLAKLKIPVAQRYEGIKKAKHKTEPQSKTHAVYQDFLPQIAKAYYDELLPQAQSSEVSYEQRNQRYEKLLEVVSDFGLSKIDQNRYKLWLLEQQTNLQWGFGDKEHYNESMRKKQNLIYQQSLLKKRASGTWFKNENYR